MTGKSIEHRFKTHCKNAERGKTTKLYSAMRRYGITNFSVSAIAEFETREACEQGEISAIANSLASGEKLYNMTSGGDGGWCVVDLAAWVIKIKLLRKGKQPSLGMKHTDSNKRLFADVSKAYWDTQEKYNHEEVLSMRFVEANKIYGISKTHYYRLKKLFGSGLSEKDLLAIERYKKPL